MKRLKLYVLLVSTFVAFATACSPAAPAAPAANNAAPSNNNNSATVNSTIPDVQVTAQDFAFSAPDQIQSGLVSLTMTNQGKEEHHGILARMNEGVTMQQLQTAMQSGGDVAALSLVTLAGGPGLIPPGASQTVTVNVQPGNYLLLCFVSGDDNVPHVAKGMIKPVQVASAPSGAAGAPNPAANNPKSDGTVTLKDFTITMPDNITAGNHTFEVTNPGPQPHELTIVKLEQGKTMADVQAMMQGNVQGPPPFAPYGGMSPIAPGGTAWITENLTPGDYIALCFVPDPATGKAHVELGMLTPFTVK